MKISYNESGKAQEFGKSAGEKILPKDRPRGRVLSKTDGAADLSPLEQGMAIAEMALKDVPDVRENLVADLKERIQKGEYNVSGKEIADMMLRRRAADRVR